MQNLMDIERIRPEKIDKEQFYLQSVGAPIRELVAFVA